MSFAGANFPFGSALTAVAPRLQDSMNDGLGPILPIIACPPSRNRDRCCAGAQEPQQQKEGNFLNLKCLPKARHFLRAHMKQRQREICSGTSVTPNYSFHDSDGGGAVTS